MVETGKETTFCVIILIISTVAFNFGITEDNVREIINSSSEKLLQRKIQENYARTG